MGCSGPGGTADGRARAGLATYLLIWPDDGILRKEDVRGVFDGSIFYQKAEQHRQKGLGKDKHKHKRLM